MIYSQCEKCLNEKRLTKSNRFESINTPNRVRKLLFYVLSKQTALVYGAIDDCLVIAHIMRFLFTLVSENVCLFSFAFSQTFRIDLLASQRKLIADVANTCNESSLNMIHPMQPKNNNRTRTHMRFTSSTNFCLN